MLCLAVMNLAFADYFFWFATPILMMGVLIGLYRRGLHRDYPYFFNYAILQVISAPVLACIHSTQTYAFYYYAYYFNIALSVLLSFGVLQEIFADAFRPYEALRDLSIILFRWSALVVLLVGVMWAINTARSANADPVMDFVLLGERSVRLMQCGLVFFLLLFSEYLGIARRSLLFGISLGFGIFAAVNMLITTGASQHSIIHHSVLRQANSGAYLLAVVIWLGYTLAAAPSKSKLDQESLLRSEDWNSALQEARTPVADSSLLDTMDRTVERLLYPPTEAQAKIPTERV
jgi:hypothetical protein